ncbi:MAG: small ribosomal subunit Rsm22 family protein [Sandaracinaceae bacterium]|nr:small ribosomal subunit Rsm22 family protein [Sandaracinaceae bacterium]
MNPLTGDWLDAIDHVARRVLGPADRKGAPLVSEIRALSELYTRERHALHLAGGPRAARVRFFLPRDLPKIEGPLSFLAAHGLLPRERTWSVVDLGAGYGATTLGLARLAKRLDLADAVHVTAIDDDPQALDVLDALARETRGGRLRSEAVPIELEPIVGSVAITDPSILVRGRGLALAGFVMNELFTTHGSGPSGAPRAPDDPDRLELLERWLTRVTRALAPEASFVLLEPALRTPTRVLQTLRDRLIEGALDVPFPCAHRAKCPLLSRDRDWCHAELPLALPEPLAELAREAGLRFEGLSYATLAVRNAPPRPPTPRAATIVGGPIASKGKVELHLCHERGLTRLDWMTRDGAPPESLHRGARVVADRAPVGDRARHGRDLTITPE